MSDRCRTTDFEFRGKTYELWTDGYQNYLADPETGEFVDTADFSPPLTNDELLSIDDYGRDR